jgi:hypothetical protein
MSQTVITFDAEQTTVPLDVVAEVGVIESGPQGIKGDKGDPNTLVIGTVTTSESGGLADADITGEAPNQTLDLTLPRGIQGIQGEQGEKGDQGDDKVFLLEYGESIAQYETRTGKVIPDGAIIYEKDLVV